MNCDRIENLLSEFVDGSLSGADEAAVRAHLDGCASCRESLAAYRALEDVLVMRRAEVPPVDAILQGVLAPAPSNLHRARVLMDRLFSLPSLATFACFVLAWAAFTYSAPIAHALNWLINEAPVVSNLSGWFVASLVTLTRGDMLITVSAYAAVTLLILGSGTWMTLRYVHSE